MDGPRDGDDSAERMAAYREALDLAERFVAEGRSWVELDDDGRVVERNQAVGKLAHTAPERST